MPKSSTGFNEALVGNIRLVYHEISDGVMLPETDSHRSPIVRIYNMQGQQIPQLQNGMNIVVRADGSVSKAIG